MPRKKSKTQATEILEKLGLSENEAVLYAVMLRYPKSTVQELQTRSPLPRTMLYYVLKQLIQRGLVTAVKDQWKTKYIAENPDKLYDLLAKQEREFARNVTAVRELIPDLKVKYRLAEKRPGVRVFEGINEYKKALEDIILTKPEVVYAYPDYSGSKKPGVEVRETYENRRVLNKIQKRALLFDCEPVRTRLQSIPYNDYTQYRFITDAVEAFTADLKIYDGKILYTTYDDREPIAMLIEDQLLYEMQTNMFNTYWNSAEDATLLTIQSNK